MVRHLLFWLVHFILQADGRIGQNSPRFGKQFLSRYELSDLGNAVCTLMEEDVALPQNCIDCLKNISSILLTENGNKMYIGAKSQLISADLVKCETVDMLNWNGGTDSMNCHPNWECGNFVTRILNMENGNLVACGTNYGDPRAMMLNPDLTPLEKIERNDVPRLCAQSPSWSSSYYQTPNQIFAGVNEERSVSSITKFDNTHLQISTEGAVTSSDQWLNRAEFLASIEVGDYVYFVMREETDEGYNAAIARICKSDPGYEDDQTQINRLFLTFTKAFMTCTLTLPESKQTLDFRIIYSATYNPQTQHIYAAFSEYPDVDIGGFAVCSYRISDVDKVFEGGYQSTDEDGRRISVQLPRLINCVSYRRQDEAHLMFIATDKVKQATKDPIYYKLKQFTSLLTESVLSSGSTILYIGTSTGTVEKVVITSSGDIVLGTEFVVAKPHIEIKSMQFASEDHRMLVISTESTVSRFPVAQCTRHTELDQCIAIRDPHCCWCKSSHSCDHIGQCSNCVNDPHTGKVSTAFGRLTDYEWERKGECLPICDPSEIECRVGERIVQYMQVHPKIEELRHITENCSYTGPWEPYVPISDNVTETETRPKEAKFGSMEGERLYKILTLVFGSLFVVSLFIIVFLMVCKARKKPSAASIRKKSLIDRTNSTNIISDKPISFMTTTKMDTNSNPPMNGMIMPQDLDKLNNSPYRSQMSAEDERLLQVNIRDPSENMYSDVASAQTLPRNFPGHNPTLDRRQQTLPNFSNLSNSMQRPPPNPRYTYSPPQDLNRYPVPPPLLT